MRYDGPAHWEKYPSVRHFNIDTKAGSLKKDADDWRRFLLATNRWFGTDRIEKLCPISIHLPSSIFVRPQSVRILLNFLVGAAGIQFLSAS